MFDSQKYQGSTCLNLQNEENLEKTTGKGLGNFVFLDKEKIPKINLQNGIKTVKNEIFGRLLLKDFGRLGTASQISIGNIPKILIPKGNSSSEHKSSWDWSFCSMFSVCFPGISQNPG